MYIYDENYILLKKYNITYRYIYNIKFKMKKVSQK